MGRDTDLTVLRQAEIAGYNFAFIRGFEHYHTPLDSVDHLDRGTLQEQGEAVLALARSLVVDEFPGETEKDAMFFTFAGETWVLSAGMGNALAVLALLLALGTIGQRVSLGAVSAGGMLRAGLLWFGVVGVLGSGVGLFLVVTGIRAWLHDAWSHPSPLTAQAMAGAATS